MLEIYKWHPIMKNLPLHIESLSAYDDYFIVGTKQGHLLMYKLETKRTSTSEVKFELHLLRSNKSFAKKPIVQVEAVPDLRILVSLSDNVISVHNLDQITFPTITCINKTKGATLFVLDIRKNRSLTGEHQCTLRMCVVVRHRLLLYYWKNNDFHEMGSELKVPNTPKTIAWCEESLILGFQNDYNLIKVTGEMKDLFPTGDKHPEPIVVLLEGNRLALGREENTFIFDSEGLPILRYPIVWSDIPINLVDDNPYLMAILPNSIVEVLTVEPKLCIQKIDLSHLVSSKVKHIVKCINKKGHILVASSNDIFCIVRVPFQQQIPQLLDESHFDLALQLANTTDETDASLTNETPKEHVIKKIQNLQSFDLFCKKQFKEALALFLKLNTDPSLVIGLFPDLLPEDYRSRIEYPSKPPQLQGADLEAGLFALTDYLLEVRRNSTNSSNGNAANGSAVSTPSSVSPKPKYLLRHIIDTTLLKCYLQTNDALVASLLRLPDNYCHLEETEKALKKHHKYNELIILYQNKGLHKNALELLYKQSKRVDSPLSGYQRTIQYLQHLSSEHLSLIFEYSSWVLKEHPDEGIKIFIEDEMEQLPRDQVMEFIQKVNPDLLIQYLEHIIFVWNDTTQSFHNSLVHKYREKVRILLNEYKNALPEAEQPKSAGQEPGELGSLRTKLLQFLEVSDYYSVETLPTYLLYDGLFEERAVVMGKVGNHKEALVIYVYMLQDLQRAEEYCERMYSKRKPENKDVFLSLLGLYLNGPPPQTNDNSNLNELFTPNINAAIDLVTRHATKIDPLKAIIMLPSSVPVANVKEFLQLMTDHLLVERHGGQIFRNLLLAQRLQVHDQRIRLQRLNKVVVDEHDLCRVCQKRIGKSVFVRFPNKDLVHFMCKEKYSVR